MDSFVSTGRLALPRRTDDDQSGEGNESSNLDSDGARGGVSATPLHATAKRIFSNAHAYHINSLATNSDGQTFISADDLRINWWNLDVSDTCFSKYMLRLFTALCF